MKMPPGPPYRQEGAHKGPTPDGAHGEAPVWAAAPPVRVPRASGLSRTAGLLGIFAMLFGVTALPAVICAHWAGHRLSDDATGSDRVWIRSGLILGYLFAVAWPATFLYVWMRWGDTIRDVYGF